MNGSTWNTYEGIEGVNATLKTHNRRVSEVLNPMQQIGPSISTEAESSSEFLGH